MKLSEAIRLGAMLMPQCFHYFENDNSGEPYACCALGGASLAAGYDRHKDFVVMSFINRTWGNLVGADAIHPVNGAVMRIESIIHDLNDPTDNLPGMRWTRERIADWVETIEPHDHQEMSDETPALAVEQVSR